MCLFHAYGLKFFIVLAQAISIFVLCNVIQCSIVFRLIIVVATYGPTNMWMGHICYSSWGYFVLRHRPLSLLHMTPLQWSASACVPELFYCATENNLPVSFKDLFILSSLRKKITIEILYISVSSTRQWD